MNQIDFYFFSGTGNSKRVADWFCDEAKKAGVKTNTINLSHERSTPPAPAQETLVGFISPTHGFNYPPLMIKFLLRFPKTKVKSKVFLMNTRAGMKLSRIFLPGLSGIALWLAAIILLIKGYRIVAMRSIDLPSNWISLHPGLKQKVVSSMFSHYEHATRIFAQKIISGKKVFKASLLLGIPIDLAIAPISFGYYVIGRFVLAKTFIATKKCDNCGICINQCPVKAIKMVYNKPYWTYHCESCMHCMNYCPKRAIESAHGLLAVSLIIMNTAVLTLFYKYIPLSEWLQLLKIPHNMKGIISFTLESALLFLFVLVTYKFAHYLKRYKWADNILSYTSLTKYTFWRRYKIPKSRA